jgi:hypothetical protein
MKFSSPILVAAVAIVAGIWLSMGISAPQNPPAIASRTIEAHLAVPKDVGRIMMTSCKDCHSYETRWPWYSRLSLVSGFIREDVERARAHMNLSDWSAKLAQGDDETHAASSGMCEELRSDAMPLPKYRWMRSEARLTQADVETLCRWTDRIAGTPGIPTPLAQTVR